MGSESDKIRRVLRNDIERHIKKQNRGTKSFRREKSPEKSFVWMDQIKELFIYMLKPSKCSNSDITKRSIHEVLKTHEMQLGRNKFFNDASIENIFMHSEYLKMKSGSVPSTNFCSGENQRTTDAKNSFSSGETSKSRNFLQPIPEEDVASNEEQPHKKAGTLHIEEDLRYLRKNLDIMMGEVKMLKRDLGLVKMDLKTMEKLTLPANQSETCRTSGIQNDHYENIDLGKFSDEAENPAQKLRDFNESLETPATLDFDRIISNFHTLSEIAYEPKIIKTSNSAKFEIPKEFPVSLYEDGILLRNMEFRKYTNMRAIAFLKDIENGFFPIEIWSEYPHGVPFKVTDRRFEKYNGDTNFASRFSGNGRRLGSSWDCKPSSVVHLEPDNLNWICHPLTSQDKTEKERQNSSSSQDGYKNSNPGGIAENNKSTKENGEIPWESNPKLMSIKARLGNESEMIKINIMSNSRMKCFQDALLTELCDIHHDDHSRNVDINKERNHRTMPDFVVQTYGQKPFRLSECLDYYPSECGIVNNCVVNITEI